MKLLFDEMLAPSLVNRLADLFPESEHVRMRGLKQTSDTGVWRHAQSLGFTIVTKDKDFADLSLVWGAPPKVILLQLGNCSVQQIEDGLRRDSVLLWEFVHNSPKGLLVIGAWDKVREGDRKRDAD